MGPAGRTDEGIESPLCSAGEKKKSLRLTYCGSGERDGDGGVIVRKAEEGGKKKSEETKG